VSRVELCVTSQAFFIGEQTSHNAHSCDDAHRPVTIDPMSHWFLLCWAAPSGSYRRPTAKRRRPCTEELTTEKHPRANSDF